LNILANILSATATNFAESATNACILYMWDEPVAPDEIL